MPFDLPMEGFLGEIELVHKEFLICQYQTVRCAQASATSILIHVGYDKTEPAVDRKLRPKFKRFYLFQILTCMTLCTLSLQYSDGLPYFAGTASTRCTISAFIPHLLNTHIGPFSPSVRCTDVTSPTCVRSLPLVYITMSPHSNWSLVIFRYLSSQNISFSSSGSIQARRLANIIPTQLYINGETDLTLRSDLVHLRKIPEI